MSKFITLHLEQGHDEVLVNVDNIVKFQSFHHLKDWQWSSVSLANQSTLKVTEDKEQFLKLINEK